MLRECYVERYVFEGEGEFVSDLLLYSVAGLRFASATFVTFCCNSAEEFYNFAEDMKVESKVPRVRSILKKTTFDLGHEFESHGVMLRVVERPVLEWPCEACKGCFFVGYSVCPRSQCSSFGREDGRNVWFVDVSKL